LNALAGRLCPRLKKTVVGKARKRTCPEKQVSGCNLGIGRSFKKDYTLKELRMKRTSLAMLLVFCIFILLSIAACGEPKEIKAKEFFGKVISIDISERYQRVGGFVGTRKNPPRSIFVDLVMELKLEGYPDIIFVKYFKDKTEVDLFAPKKEYLYRDVVITAKYGHSVSEIHHYGIISIFKKNAQK
jgi:hypothetical protein